MGQQGAPCPDRQDQFSEFHKRLLTQLTPTGWTPVNMLNTQCYSGLYFGKSPPSPRGEQISADVIWGKKYVKAKRKGVNVKEKGRKGKEKGKKGK
jgi:hypothetical protein